ncbi:MAG: septal ring lytic transglycosylase RlpA family protein [Oceanococcus sp.]
MNKNRLQLLACAAILAGCSSAAKYSSSQDSSPTHVPIDPWSVAQAQPKAEPRSRYGNPESYVVFGKRYHVLDDAEGYKERGIASWYGTKFHGRRTSSGEPYDMFAMTAAHKSLPLPSFVRVRNLENGKSLVVRVNDRGPFHPGRIIDLSYTAAVQLGVYAQGSAQVEVEAITAAQEQLPTTAPPPPTPAARQEDELERFIAELPSAEQDTSPRLPFLRIAAFRTMGDCTDLRNTLSEQRVLALQILEQADQCLLVQGPFASAEDAQIQTDALRALGHSPAIIYP